jgi:hypothetical protein
VIPVPGFAELLEGDAACIDQDVPVRPTVLLLFNHAEVAAGVEELAVSTEALDRHTDPF